ncbi:hypothetical protein BLOT_012305 [Blomia tropicalis]|nr:hypothetical protein BLOT_012305 [Blomia tropicalis]
MSGTDDKTDIHSLIDEVDDGDDDDELVDDIDDAFMEPSENDLFVSTCKHKALMDLLELKMKFEFVEIIDVYKLKKDII